MSDPELYLLAGAPLYRILGELRKISIKHKSAVPCHPIMARSVAPGVRSNWDEGGRREGGGKVGGPVGERDFGENNTANNTKQIAGTTYRIHHVRVIGARVEQATSYAISNRPRYFFLCIMRACYLLELRCRRFRGRRLIRICGNERKRKRENHEAVLREHKYNNLPRLIHSALRHLVILSARRCARNARNAHSGAPFRSRFLIARG